MSSLNLESQDGKRRNHHPHYLLVACFRADTVSYQQKSMYRVFTKLQRKFKPTSLAFSLFNFYFTFIIYLPVEKKYNDAFYV